MMHADHSFATRHPLTNATLVASVLTAHASRRARIESAFAREEHLRCLRQDRACTALAVSERRRSLAAAARLLSGAIRSPHASTLTV